MKFLLKYQKPKKKQNYWSHQEAIFYDIRDAMMFERHVKTQGAINTEIRPL
jgi:hypothetical protein